MLRSTGRAKITVCRIVVASVFFLTTIDERSVNVTARVRQDVQSTRDRTNASPDTLNELRGLTRAYLVAGYTYEVDARSFGDARGYARSIIKEASDQNTIVRRRHKKAYSIIAKHLKKYGRKYKSLTLVERPEEADFFVVFYFLGNVSPPIGPNSGYDGVIRFTPWPAGQLLIVRRATSEDPQPKIIAHTERGGRAKDVIEFFIKELKIAKGER